LVSGSHFLKWGNYQIFYRTGGYLIVTPYYEVRYKMAKKVVVRDNAESKPTPRGQGFRNHPKPPKFRGSCVGHTVYVRNVVDTGKTRCFEIPNSDELVRMKIYEIQHHSAWVWNGNRWIRDFRYVETGSLTPTARPKLGNRAKPGWYGKNSK
jgi:hypothetical protein